MPRHDDDQIEPSRMLLRAVRPDWIQEVDGVEQLTSATFKDGAKEASCFIAEEVGGIDGFIKDILPVLEEECGVSFRVATVDVSTVREQGLWIYRKPEEFHDNPAHVVICPPDQMTSSQYAKRAGNLKEAPTRLLPPIEGNLFIELVENLVSSPESAIDLAALAEEAPEPDSPIEG